MALPPALALDRGDLLLYEGVEVLARHDAVPVEVELLPQPQQLFVAVALVPAAVVALEQRAIARAAGGWVEPASQAG